MSILKLKVILRGDLVMDNTKLARFLTSLGSLNGYGSTVAQTKKALDTHSSDPLIQSNDDVAIFEDALSGIKAIKKYDFSVEGIIAINKGFDSPSDEEPNMPGHLRNAFYNEDDRLAITIDPSALEGDNYIPKDIITKSDLQLIVDQFSNSKQTERDAWRVFADLSKL